MKAALIGFHRITTRHTGVNIAKAILEVLDRAKVTLKVFLIFAIPICSHAQVVLDWPLHTVLRLTSYYAQQRVLCMTRTRVLKAVDEDKEIGNNRQ